MNTEKSLIVYYSNSGFTKQLAKELSRNIHCDIEEIKTSISYSGFFGYQRAFFHSLMNREPLIKRFKHNPADYNLVIVGGPIWAGSTAAPVRSFLVSNKDIIKNIAFFSTQGGPYGKKQLFEQMEKLCGIKPMACLSVTDKALTDGTFQQSVWIFLNELQQNIAKKIGIKISKREPLVLHKEIPPEQPNMH